MSRKALVSISILLLGTGGVLLSMNGCGVSNRDNIKLPPNYNLPHVVIIFRRIARPTICFRGCVFHRTAAAVPATA